MTESKAAAQKPAPLRLDGIGFFTNLAAHIGNFVLAIQGATGKVWRATEGLHLVFRMILTAVVGVLSIFGAGLLGPVVFVLYAAAAYLDLSYLDTKAWLKLNGGLILGGFCLMLLWSVANSGPLGFVMAFVILCVVSAQLNSWSRPSR